ncbi:uncharacterized protein RCO7_08609 [Rhynchosporium graminicola]|uniref:Methyltransferase domain-containing protein n=1 Tax=Rhynchosporium graminicola TaxID=2792576 RepID=A0A1E1JX31_9HELO|nr:uncharacterized protein RCO7_08609 [Rhynchosporium commune]
MRIGPSHVFTALTAVVVGAVVWTHFGTDSGLSSISTGITASLTGLSLKSLMARSEKLWEKTVKQRHEVMAKFPDMGFFPAVNTPTYFTTPYSVWDLIPASYNCPHEVERIGRMGDGGKWVCGMSKYEKNTRPCIIYSFGVQNESSFEQEMLERTNCEIWGYDFSVNAFGPAIMAEHASRTHFRKAGISGTTQLSKKPPFITIQDIMAENGHTYIDILKIDIEYAEFEALKSFDEATAHQEEYPIGQMLIELHLFKKEKIDMVEFLAWWEALEARGLRPAWTEPNLLAVTVSLEDKNPRLAEYSLVNIKGKSNPLWK